MGRAWVARKVRGSTAMGGGVREPGDGGQGGDRSLGGGEQWGT